MTEFLRWTARRERKEKEERYRRTEGEEVPIGNGAVVGVLVNDEVVVVAKPSSSSNLR